MSSDKIVIGQKIVGYEVKKDGNTPSLEVEKKVKHVSFLDKEMPKRGNGSLVGETFKVNNPTTEESSVYCTINFRRIDNKFRLAELFLSSKDTTHQQYAMLSTRILSALARRTGRIGFIVSEMKEVRNSTGGYRVYIDDEDGKPVFVNGEVAHIGHCIERACRHFNVMDKYGNIIDHNPEVKVDFGINFQDKGYSNTTMDDDSEVETTAEVSEDEASEDITPVKPVGTKCTKCHEYAVRRIDGCDTCTNCGDSRCG